MTLPAHWFCRRAWLLKLTDPGAAENNNFYILTQVIKHPSIPCADHVERMLEIDEITPFLPCLKDEEGMPKELPRGDVTMPAVTMCKTILNSLPAGLQTAYYALKGANHCPLNVQDLKKDLSLVETQANQLAQATKFVNQASKTKAQTSSAGGAGQMTSEKQRIPKKTKGKTTGENPKGKGNQKLCNKCVQWAPQIKNTHNTRDCYRWNNDGTPMNKKQKGAATNDSNSHAIVKEVKAKENRMVAKIDQLEQNQQKFQKEVMKFIGKSSTAKKRKHRRRGGSSSSSSDESDQEIGCYDHSVLKNESSCKIVPVCETQTEDVCSVCVENQNDLACIINVCTENIVCEHKNKKPNKNNCQYCLPNNSNFNTMPIKIVDKQNFDLKSKVVKGKGIRTAIAGIPMIAKSNKKSR